MAFSGNESGSTESRKRLYIGLEKFKVTAFNPNKAQLAEMGIIVDDELNYISEDEGVKTSRVAIYLDNDDTDNNVKTVLSIFLRDEHQTTMSGKLKWINNEGISFYGTQEDIDNKNFYDWMKQEDEEGNTKVDLESFVPCKSNQEELVNFIKTFANVKNGDPAYIENMDALFNGDFSELNGLLEHFPNNKVGVLLGVKTKDDGTLVQTHYLKKFERGFSTDMSYLQTSVNSWRENGGGSNVDFGNFPYNFREYVPTAAGVDSSAEDDIPF